MKRVEIGLDFKILRATIVNTYTIQTTKEIGKHCLQARNTTLTTDLRNVRSKERSTVFSVCLTHFYVFFILYFLNSLIRNRQNDAHVSSANDGIEMTGQKMQIEGIAWPMACSHHVYNSGKHDGHDSKYHRKRMSVN